MDSRLADFLIALSADPRRMDSFEADPETAMAVAGLTPRRTRRRPEPQPQADPRRPGGEPQGSLTVVGTGVRPAHLTPQACLALERAQKVFYLLPDPAAAERIRALNGSAESSRPLLGGATAGGDPPRARRGGYPGPRPAGPRHLRRFFGHPGVLTYAARLALRQCRQEGFPAEMLPGISAQDCLYADLGVDPGRAGCQSYEAADFLVYRRRFDPTSHLILWQIGAIGTMSSPPRPSPEGLQALVETLVSSYGPGHGVAVYEPGTRSGEAPRVAETALSDLPGVAVTLFSMLYVPPLPPRPPDPEILDRMGLSVRPAKE